MQASYLLQPKACVYSSAQEIPQLLCPLHRYCRRERGHFHGNTWELMCCQTNCITTKFRGKKLLLLKFCLKQMFSCLVLGIFLLRTGDFIDPVFYYNKIVCVNKRQHIVPAALVCCIYSYTSHIFEACLLSIPDWDS